MFQNNRDIIIHLVKKVGYLVVLLFVSTKFFEFIFRNDTRGSIAGDSSDWNIILINFILIIGYLIYLAYEAIVLKSKKLIALRNVNIFIQMAIVVLIILAFLF